MIHRLLLLCLFTAMASSQLFTQSITYSGCVTDESGHPLIGASVLIEGSDVGTITDVNGCFRLTNPADTLRLLLTYPGFQPKSVEFGKHRPEMNVRLSEGRILMEEVMVTEDASEYAHFDAAKPSVSRRSEKTKKDRSASDMSFAAPAATEMRFSDDVSSASTSGPEGGVLPTAGQLTAGEVNDFGKWDIWEDVSKEDLAAFREVWNIFPQYRYTTQVTYPGGFPAANAPVKLTDQEGRLIYQAVTDNQGRAELWAGLLDQQYSKQAKMELSVRLAGRNHVFSTTKPFSQGINVLEIPLDCKRETTVDIAFVVDATGSMGDEISYLSSELLDVMQRSQDSLIGQDVRFTSVFYRDNKEEYLTRHQDFGKPQSEIVDFVKAQSAGGGGDTPEAVDAALDVALNQLSWSSSAAARLLFLVLDAPPHSDAATVAKLQRLALLAAEKGVRIIPVVCSGMDQSGEYLLRSIALATNGTYTFLTNHSGIGNDHLEPSTDSYKVEKLNNLLVRLIYQYGQTSDCAVIAKTDQQPIDEEETNWSVFPNPTFGPATVKLPQSKGTLLILDSYGKLLQRYEVNSKNLSIDLGGFPSGTYLLRYRSGEKISSRKLIVNRA